MDEGHRMHASIKGEVSESRKEGGGKGERDFRKKIAGTIHAQNREGPPLDSRKGPQGSSDRVRGTHSQKWQPGGAFNV